MYFPVDFPISDQKDHAMQEERDQQQELRVNFLFKFLLSQFSEYPGLINDQNIGSEERENV